MNFNFFGRKPVQATTVSYEELVPEVVQESQQYAQANLAMMSEKAERYTRIVRWAVLVGTFLMPILFLPWSTGILELNKQILLVVVAGVGLVAWLLGIVISGQLSLRMTNLDRGVAAILGATVLATIFSLAPHKSLFGLSASLSDSLVSVVALTIFYFLAVNTFNDRGRSLYKAFASGVLLALLFGLLQMFTVYLFPGFTHSRAFNSVGSANALGVLAALALPLFGKIDLRFWRLRMINFAWLGVAASLAVLVVLNWWVLWAIAIAGMLTNIAFDSLALAAKHSRQEHSGLKMAQFLLPMTVIVLAVFFMIVNIEVGSVKTNLPVEIAPSYRLSFDIVKSVLKQNLIFGLGPENFSIAFDKFGASSLANSTFSNLQFLDSTSQFFNYIIHGGVVMLLAFLYLVWVLVTTFNLARKDEGASSILLAPEFSAVCGAVVAGFVAGFVGLLLYPFNLTLFSSFYVGLALLTLLVWHDSRVWNIEENPFVSLGSALGFIVGLILVLSGVYFTSVQYLSDVTFASALTSKNNDAAIAKLVKAINWNSQDDRYYRVASQGVLNLLSAEIGKKSNDPQQAAKIQNYIVSAIDLARRATQAGSNEANNWFNLGMVYQSLIGLVDGVDRLAEESYQKAADLRPGDASFHNQAGSMYLGEADLIRQVARNSPASAEQLNKNANTVLEKAETYFKKAIEASPNYGMAIYNLGIVYDRQGKLNDSIKQIEKIIPYNANEPNLVFELGLLYYRAARKNDAFAALQRAVVLSPSYANARWYLALIYEERDDFASAIDQLEKILETNKDNQTILEKLEQLRSGKKVIPPKRVIDQKPL